MIAGDGSVVWRMTCRLEDDMSSDEISSDSAGSNTVSEEELGKVGLIDHGSLMKSNQEDDTPCALKRELPSHLSLSTGCRMSISLIIRESLRISDASAIYI